MLVGGCEVMPLYDTNFSDRDNSLPWLAEGGMKVGVRGGFFVY